MKVGVFIDYQNAYHRAREAFGGPYASAQAGQFHPMALGHALASQDEARVLGGVHAYRGQPDPRRDPKGAGACQRQINAWRAVGASVKTGPLGGYQYGKPGEKDIDVLLALDFVFSALQREYDVQVLVSADSDLLPALERVQEISETHVQASRDSVALETVVWMPPTGGAKRLRTGKLPVKERTITEAQYRKIEDTRDYAVPK